MATLAAIISDTHGLLRPQVLERLKRCDCIVHAGDFDDEDTLDWLRELAPLYAVRGNNDWEMARRLPVSLRFRIEELDFFMAHCVADVPTDLDGVDAVIFGHSHRYCEALRGGVLWLNPGSCGRRRFGLELSFAMMRVDGKNYRIEKILLPADSKQRREGAARA